MRIHTIAFALLQSGTDVRVDLVSLLLSLKGKFSSFSPDLTSFPSVPDYSNLPFFLPGEIEADKMLVLFSSCFSSNSKGSANRKLSEFSHS